MVLFCLNWFQVLSSNHLGGKKSAATRRLRNPGLVSIKGMSLASFSKYLEFEQNNINVKLIDILNYSITVGELLEALSFNEKKRLSYYFQIAFLKIKIKIYELSFQLNFLFKCVKIDFFKSQLTIIPYNFRLFRFRTIPDQKHPCTTTGRPLLQDFLENNFQQKLHLLI